MIKKIVDNYRRTIINNAYKNTITKSLIAAANQKWRKQLKDDDDYH